MASIHKDSRGKTPYFYCALTLPNGKRTTRSTKQTDRRKAQAVADSWEKAARMARDGILQDNAARKTISDLYELANGQALPSSKAETYFNSWLGEKKLETAGSTHRKYRDVINRFLSFLGLRGEEDIARISAQDITDFRNSEARRVSISSTNHALKVLRSALRHAYRLGFIHVNPADRVSGIKQKEAGMERRAFTMLELRKLLECASFEWQGLILFGLYTGQRLSDIATLTWRNVDVIRREISLTTSKTRRRQILPIADELLDFIERMPAGENPTQPLFQKAFEVIAKYKRSAVLSNRFYSLMAEAGLVEPRNHRSRGIGRSASRKLNELSFHCLRHTTTSLLKNAGTNSAISEEFVGHDSPAISRLYTHIDTEAMRKAINAVPRILS
jgi:integrase